MELKKEFNKYRGRLESSSSWYKHIKVYAMRKTRDKHGKVISKNIFIDGGNMK